MVQYSECGHPLNLGDRLVKCNHAGSPTVLEHSCRCQWAYGFRPTNEHTSMSEVLIGSCHPGSACCTDDMSEIFVFLGQCLCCLLPAFVNRQPPCPDTNSRHVLLHPRMHRNNLWFTKEHAPGMDLTVGGGGSLPTPPLL